MCRTASAVLPAAPSSPYEVRRFVTGLCARWEIEPLADDLRLVLSELVTNALLHARTPVTVNVAVAQGLVEVGVSDGDPTEPVVRPQRADLISDVDTLTHRLPNVTDENPRDPSLSVGPSGSIAAGRGMHLVAGVAVDWGVAPAPDSSPGKTVWVRLPAPPSWPHADSCACGGRGSVQTASGRPVLHSPGAWDA